MKEYRPSFTGRGAYKHDAASRTRYSSARQAATLSFVLSARDHCHAKIVRILIVMQFAWAGIFCAFLRIICPVRRIYKLGVSKPRGIIKLGEGKVKSLLRLKFEIIYLL